MLVPDPVVWISVLVLAIYLTDLAWDHSALFMPNEGEARPIGYAHILTWIRATGFMLIAGVVWLFLGLYSITLNNCFATFAACYTSPTYASTGSITVDYLGASLWPLFLGLFFLHLVVGIVMVVYLVLPIESRPGWLKSLFDFGGRGST